MPRSDRDRAVALPVLRGRTALVTGASSGVGLEIARALAAAGCEVLLPVRDRGRGDAAVTRIRETVADARLELLDLDLARLDSVRDLVGLLRTEDEPLDYLVLNAGMVQLGDRERHVTGDGHELHFQTNFLGHAVLALGILPLLRGGPGGDARVAVQCSLATRFIDVDLDDPEVVERYTPLRAYGSSKTALGLFGFELARRAVAHAWGFTAHLCHPGIAPATAIAPLVRQRAGWIGGLVELVGNDPASAAQPALLALTSDAPPPAFFAPSGLGQIAGRAAPRPPFERVFDAHRAGRVWHLAERLAASG